MITYVGIFTLMTLNLKCKYIYIILVTRMTSGRQADMGVMKDPNMAFFQC